jgi:hypothetical protein
MPEAEFASSLFWSLASDTLPLVDECARHLKGLIIAAGIAQFGGIRGVYKDQLLSERGFLFIII